MAHVIFIISIFLSWSFCIGDLQLQLQSNGNCESGVNCERREQNRSVCPAGFSCPEGSITPVPCPAGTFRAMDGPPARPCLNCPVNFFNPRPGQEACLPCGSAAVQPREGQETCVCLGEGQVFQPSDAFCPCAPGYRSIEDEVRYCIRQVYDICRDGSSRNQEGQCLTKKEWAHYCSDKVCAVREDYQGYDKVLGLCICRVDDLERVCNSQCRRQQRDILQIACKEGRAQLSVSYRNKSQVAIFLEKLKATLHVLYFPDKDACTLEHSDSSHPVYMVKTSGEGFLGVYNPDPKLLHRLIVPSEISPPHKNEPAAATAAAAALAKSGKEDPGPYWAQSQRPSNSTPKITFTGILNPTTCIGVNTTLLFIVSKDHYPVYDVNNLYNTNHGFDWGGFRRLAEDVRVASSANFHLLLYQFQHPGVYVIGLSSNQHKKMYIRVMPYGGQCYEEGPFFSTTPRHVIQAGIARSSNLPLKPDWPAIIGLTIGLLVVLLASLLLSLLCQELGWAKRGTTCPPFRRLQLKYNLDKYCSKGSTVISVKKYHPILQNKGSLDDNSDSPDGTEAFFLEKGEMWLSEEQIDLDSFNTNVFFEILLTQSLSVTAKLSQFKEELKTLYHKLTDEVSSLKELWITRLCIPEEMGPSDSIKMGTCLRAKQEAEEEILHRKQLAAEYEESVNKQLHLLQQDLECQEEHYVTFSSALREAVSLAEMLTDKIVCGGDKTMWSKPGCQRLLSQIDAASNKMSSAIVKESHRLKAWGVLGEGTGAHLVNKDKTRLLTKEELMGPDGSMRALDAVRVDPTTGLLTPDPECVVLLANRCLVPVSRDLFLHPETGKVLPVAGNIGYDPISSKLVCAVDSSSGELQKSGAPVFPYVPYPICPSTGLPVKTNLPVLHPEKVFKLGGLMLDPATEIEVPVLAVTIHPQTGQKLSVGGTYLNPLTGTVTPLELGGPMNEPKGGKIVPILGVNVDSNTGDVIPVGGLMGPSGSPILLGDSFSEPLSGKSARVHGAFLQQDTVLPHAGGYGALLEASMLIAQMHVVKTLRQYQDSMCEDLSVTVDRQRVLKAAIEDMKKTLSIKLHYDMHWLRSLETQRDIASSLRSNGGKLGMIKCPGTEMWIPAVFGVKIPDPGGSGLMVPVLGLEPDWNTGLPAPLAGTMEDADGQGLVPITIGARTIDPITGEPGPVIGVRTNPWTSTVVPIVQSLGALPRGAADPDLLNLLENEINSRQNYWHCQREKEDYLQKELNFVFLDILDAVEEGKVKKIRYKEKLKDIEEMCHFLEESSLQEAQRRTARDLSSLLGLELSLQWKVNSDEREQEAKLLLVIRKMLEKLMEFIKKMQLAESRMQIQLKEKEQQRSKSPNAETATSLRPRKATLHLLAEFQQRVKKQQGSVESASSRLEYLRKLSNIQALQAKARLSGTPQCFETYPGTRFYSFAGVPHGASEDIHRKLIPLLKSLIQTLGESKRSPMSPEMLVLGSDKGYCSQSTLKASTAHSEAFLACSGPEVAPPALLSPLQPSSSPSKIPHIQQEVQTRFFLEKHASELMHLELSLMTEEINTICSFYESSKALEKEEHKESRDVKSNKEMAMGRKWDTLLQDLAGCHQEAEQTLRQKHWEDIKNSGLSLDVGTPKDSLHFLEEIPHHFSLLDPGSRISDSHIRSDVAKEQEAVYSLEEKLFPDSTTQILQASAVKIVKLEAMRQVCLYRVLDHYSALQRQACPEGLSRILSQLEYGAAGEAVAREVAQAVEKQQVPRAMAFLQKHYHERDLLLGLKEESEGKLRHLQKQFQRELHMQTEEKLQAKETQVIHKAERPELRNHVERLIYFILSQRHLRQTVIMLQDCFRLQTANERTQNEDGHLEELAIEEPLLDDDLKSILHLMKDHTEHRSSVLELKQAANLLQLRERQYREVARGLKDHSLDKAADDADTATDGLREFGEQTIRRLTEQLKIAMGNRRTRENTPSPLHPAQIKKPTLEAENKRGKGEEIWEIFQEKQLELEESDRWQISDEGAKLQDQLERGDLRSWMMHKLVKEHNDTPAFSEKAFQQDLEKLRMRPEQEKQQEKGPSSSSSTSSHTQEKPSQTCDQVVALFAESIKILKQTEKVMASRISLLNPQFLCDRNKGKCLNTSPLLALLRDVNDQLRTHAKAAGLLESQQEKGTGRSFRDISDVLMTHKGKLKPVHPQALSAREFVVYQYGISILQFLRLHINAPEINLCIATSIPHSNAAGNAFRNSFFYQNFEKKLFVLRECLGSVGSFLLLLVHCLAHIAAADLSQDSSPAFLRLFYQALKACLSETFSLRLRMSALLQDNKSSERISEILLKGEPLMEGNINLLSQLFDAKVESSTETETSGECKRNLLLHANLEDLLKNTLSGKKRGHFIPSSAECKEKSSAGRTRLREETCSSFSPAEMEEKLDALTEELVKIMEEEHHYLSSAANDDLPFDHLEIIGLERDCLVKQIEMLERKIAEGRGGLG